MNCRCDSILLCIPESRGMKCKHVVDSHMTKKWLSLDVPISLNDCGCYWSSSGHRC